MDKLMLLLIHPVRYDADGEQFVGKTKDKKQYKRRWEEFARLEECLKEIGFARMEKDPSFSMSETGFYVEGCNWDGRMYGDVFTITNRNIKILEGKAKEIAALRDRALAKLTPEEQAALGLIGQE